MTKREIYIKHHGFMSDEVREITAARDKCEYVKLDDKDIDQDTLGHIKIFKNNS